MAKNNETTTKFKVDISDLKKGIQDAQRQIRLANAEFKAAASGMDNWASSADGISAKLKQLGTTLNAQESVLSNLKQQYAAVAKEQGENSKGAQELAIKIANQEAAINGTKKSIDKYEQALNEVDTESDNVAKSSDKAEKGIDDVGDAAGENNGKVSEFASGLADLAKKGMATLVTAAAGVVTAFLGSAEATREFRVAMGKVNTAFTQAGFSAETGKKTFEDFAAILGDTDQATEAVGNLAKLATSEKDLAKWTTIATGVYATFGDGLPIEGLAEAANETAKVAQVTGPLADAINWSTTKTEDWNKALAGNKTALDAFNKGIESGENAEDSFNLALQACNSEQERSQLITETLTSLYGDAAAQYQELNGDIMDANRAQAQLNEAMAGIGAAAEPVMTTLKLFGAQILTSMLPGVQQLAEGFTDLTNGVEGADAKIGGAISNILTNLVTNITNMLPTIASVGINLITSLLTGIVQALPQLATSAVGIINTLVSSLTENAPQLLTTAVTLWQTLYNGIMTGIPKLLELGSEMLTKIGDGIGSNLPSFASKALDALNGFADMLTENLPKLIDAGISFIQNMVKGLMDSLPTFIEKAPEIITKFANLINDNMPKILNGAVNIILTMVKGIISAIPTLIANIPKIIQAIVAVWEAFNWVNLGKKAITFLKDGIVNMIGAVKTAGQNVLEGITGALKELPSKLLQFGKDSISKLASALKDGISTVKGKAAEIMKGLVNSFKPSNMISIGKDLVKGLWNGISDMTGWIINKIKGFGDSVLSGIKKFFGIHSPSTVMRDQVGKYLSEGIAVGIENNKGYVDKAFADIKKDLSQPIDFNIKGAKAKVNAKPNGVIGVNGGNGQNNTSYTFNQYNTSPKPLSRLEIYRQTKNQLNFAKGV